MVKWYIISEEGIVEYTKFSREYNTYGVGEELLYPVEMNDSKCIKVLNFSRKFSKNNFNSVL